MYVKLTLFANCVDQCVSTLVSSHHFPFVFRLSITVKLKLRVVIKSEIKIDL